MSRGVVPELSFLDITTNSMLFERYRHEIPVVAIDGEELFKLRVDPAALRSRLLARASSAPSSLS